MATYPGQRSQRGSVLLAVAVVVALGVGLLAGWALFHDGSKSSDATASPCPGGQHDRLEQARAAACLLDAYLALIDEPSPTRDELLAQIVLPANLARERASYPVPTSAPVNSPGDPVRYAKVATEYAAVAAVKAGTATAPDAYQAPDEGFTAWVAKVDSYADGSVPLCNWYLGHFAVRWNGGRWWLSDRFHADENATPMSYTQGAQSGAFGPGWVAA